MNEEVTTAMQIASDTLKLAQLTDSETERALMTADAAELIECIFPDLYLTFDVDNDGFNVAVWVEDEDNWIGYSGDCDEVDRFVSDWLTENISE